MLLQAERRGRITAAATVWHDTLALASRDQALQAAARLEDVALLST